MTQLKINDLNHELEMKDLSKIKGGYTPNPFGPYPPRPFPWPPRFMNMASKVRLQKLKRNLLLRR
ncbi:MAG: hypothetical protein V7629_19465 [Motiliproteus sp.]